MTQHPAVLHLTIEDDVFFYCDWSPAVSDGLAALNVGAVWNPATSFWKLPRVHAAQAAVVFSSLGYVHKKVMHRPPQCWSEMLLLRLDVATAKQAYKVLKSVLDPHICGRDDYLTELEDGADFAGIER